MTNLNYELISWIVFLCAVMWSVQTFLTVYFRACRNFANSPLPPELQKEAEENGRREAQLIIDECERKLKEERERENK